MLRPTQLAGFDLIATGRVWLIGDTSGESCCALNPLPLGSQQRPLGASIRRHGRQAVKRTGLFRSRMSRAGARSDLARALFEMADFAFFVTWYLQAAVLLAAAALSLAYLALPLWLGVPGDSSPSASWSRRCSPLPITLWCPSCSGSSGW